MLFKNTLGIKISYKSCILRLIAIRTVKSFYLKIYSVLEKEIEYI